MTKITNMRNILNIVITIMASASLVSCFENSKPNFQYMPNMYTPVGYETYGEYEIFAGSQEAMLPAEGSIARGWRPYEYPNTVEGLEQARQELKNPLAVSEKNLEEGKNLFDIYCAVCHGDKGDGQGILTEREKFLGVPSYSDEGRNITEGGVYHVQMYGLNAMGSYSSQTNELERWQIVQHVMNLTASLKGEPLMTPGTQNESMGMVSLTEDNNSTNVETEDVESSEEH
jgi:mono/diheme cytochrome c family protein